MILTENNITLTMKNGSYNTDVSHMMSRITITMCLRYSHFPCLSTIFVSSHLTFYPKYFFFYLPNVRHILELNVLHIQKCFWKMLQAIKNNCVLKHFFFRFSSCCAICCLLTKLLLTLMNRPIKWSLIIHTTSW